MPVLKWLNRLLFVENLLGVYRSYCNQKKIKKYFIIFHIFIQTLCHTILFIFQIYLLTIRDANPINLTYGGFATSAYTAAMYLVVNGIVYSRAFQSYLRSISRVSDTFKDDQKLINSLKKVYWLSMILILLIITFGVLRFVEVIKTSRTHSERLIVGVIMVSQSLLRITNVFTYLMYFVVIMIVFLLAKCLTSLISSVQERVGRCDISSDVQCGVTREQIHGWVELYRDLTNCCDMVKLYFGRQFFFSLLFCAAYYVMLIFQICYMNPFRKNSTDEFNAGVIIVCYMSVLIMPIIAGQKVRNQGIKLHQALVRLYNTLVVGSNETDMKLVKDFIRLMKKNPIEIKLLSKMPAGMYVLPVMLTLSVNYLIVVMQFTHIV